MDCSGELGVEKRIVESSSVVLCGKQVAIGRARSMDRMQVGKYGGRDRDPFIWFQKRICKKSIGGGL